MKNTANELERETQAISRHRKLIRIAQGQNTSDGASVNLKRVLGSQVVSNLDPFLLLDEFRSDNPDDYIAGFPEHPHRGFETVTYMLAGRMRHKDSRGNEGVIAASDVQWMTAGRGIVHSEMPEQEDGLMWGFQLWLNLPAKQKLTDPYYQNILSADIPEYFTENGVRVRIIAGHSHGMEGAARGIVTEPLYLDLTVPEGAKFVHPIPEGHQAFIYTYGEHIKVNRSDRLGPDLKEGEMGILSDGNSVELEGGAGSSQLLLLAAKPLKEPIARYGPFVMNTQEEILQAVKDFRSGQFD